jgi:RNA polymerase sigma factor (sigma-70 family)
MVSGRDESMDEHAFLAKQFEANRTHLRAVAYRMLSSASEADDAVQEAWLHLNRSGTSGVENLGGWLTTVVARVCLDMLRSRKSRREEPVGAEVPEPADRGETTGAEQEAVLADSVGLAVLALLETLAPAERVAFVLHDMFDLPFDEIAPIVGRSSVAVRQLASRARRRVQGAATVSDSELDRQRDVVDAFLVASRTGNLQALLAVLDPDVVLRADATAVRAAGARPGAPPLAGELRGAAAVAGTFSGRAQGARPAVVNGSAGAAWAPNGKLRGAFAFTIKDGKIVEISVVNDPESLAALDVELLDD